MATLYLLTALSCAAIAWQPYLWEWMIWDAPYRKGDGLKEEIARIIFMAALFALSALFSLFASAHLFSRS